MRDIEQKRKKIERVEKGKKRKGEEGKGKVDGYWTYYLLDRARISSSSWDFSRARSELKNSKKKNYLKYVPAGKNSLPALGLAPSTVNQAFLTTGAPQAPAASPPPMTGSASRRLCWRGRASLRLWKAPGSAFGLAGFAAGNSGEAPSPNFFVTGEWVLSALEHPLAQPPAPGGVFSSFLDGLK